MVNCVFLLQIKMVCQQSWKKNLMVTREEPLQSNGPSNRRIYRQAVMKKRESTKTYAFLNIEKGGENSNYLDQGYVSNEGWYFVQKQDFVINLSLQDNYQGGTLTEDEVENLMANFTFHWDYDGMPEGMQNQRPVGGMMGAEVTHNDKAITVSGPLEVQLKRQSD